MTGNLDEALVALLKGALPSLFGGATPVVQVDVVAGELLLDPASVDGEAGQPRSDAASETLAFDAERPEGPYQLSRPPDGSVRKVRLTTAAGDRIPLQDSEVIFAVDDPRRFTLALRAGRDLTDIDGVLVLYGVTAVYLQLQYTQALSVQLQSGDAAALERAQALALAVLTLNRPELLAAAARNEQADDYRAELTLKALQFLGGDAPSNRMRRLRLRAELEMKAVRALAEGEGRPIRHIRSPGSASERPVDIDVIAEL